MCVCVCVCVATSLQIERIIATFLSLKQVHLKCHKLFNFPSNFQVDYNYVI